jgi:taurine dioxygenase
MIEIEPLTNGIAARVHGIDLASELAGSLEKQAGAQIEAAWQQHPILVFGDQNALTTEAQVAFVEGFAKVIEERLPGDQHSFVSNQDGHGLDNMTEGYREGPLTPHMDYTYTPFPADVISLFAVDVPQNGTATRFYDNARPLKVMPRALRAQIEAYTIFCAHDLAAMKPDARPAFEGRTDPAAPTQSHIWPMVRSHPKRRDYETLVCTLQQTERIMELSDEERGDPKSRALLTRIFDEYLYVPENEYVHEWEVGDLVVWDNLGVQHARDACPPSEGARIFRRVAGCDAGNAIEDTVAFLGLAAASDAFS